MIRLSPDPLETEEVPRVIRPSPDPSEAGEVPSETVEGPSETGEVPSDKAVPRPLRDWGSPH